MLKFLQKIGKSLMLPIAALPAAGLLLRFGQPDLLDIPFLATCGDALFANLPLLFAIGIAIGLSDDENGAAGLAGAIGYLILENGTKTLWIGRLGEEAAKGMNMAAFGGIIAGIVAGLTYNKFKGVKLPEFLGFFGGRRLVPIMTSLFMLILGYAISWVWPMVQNGLDSINGGLLALGAVGAGIFGFFNRLLIPVGLHHVFNNYFWFNLGEFNGKTGDIGRFFEGDPTAGMYMSGFFPIMMFGLPAVALAIYFTAKKEKRKAVAGMLASLALTSCITGITEPLEFLFIFLSPVLLVIHAVLTGLSMAVTTLFGVRDGFTFSAGLMDYTLNFSIATKPLLIIPIGLAIGALYFAIFYWAIKKFNIPTPGREEDDDELVDSNQLASSADSNETAKAFIENLGGRENIETVGNCATRLRIELKDNSVINEKALKALGGRGVIKMGKTSLQVIIGTNVQFVADAINAELKR